MTVGHPDLLDAVNMDSATLPYARLLIAGKGHLEATLKADIIVNLIVDLMMNIIVDPDVDLIVIIADVIVDLVVLPYLARVDLRSTVSC